VTAADHDLGDQQRPVHSTLPVAAKGFQGRHAGVVSRCLAGAVDLGVVALLVASVYFAIAGAALVWDPKHADLPTFPRSVAVTAAGVLAVLYLAAAWSTSGRTVGGQLLGLRVEGRGGERLHILRSLVRAVVCVLLPVVGLLVVTVDRKRRSLADFVVVSIVVYDWSSRALWDED
jgi:uncharacterized RDD family membrane protein YckC